MRSVSIGTPAVSPSACDNERRQAGFTLIESLVALSLLLCFAIVLGPLLFQARHILTQGHGEIRAEILLHSLLQKSFDRSRPIIGWREGDNAGLHWRLDVEPFIDDAGLPEAPRAKPEKAQPFNWALFRVSANVSWGLGQAVAAETLRLGQVE